MSGKLFNKTRRRPVKEWRTRISCRSSSNNSSHAASSRQHRTNKKLSYRWQIARRICANAMGCWPSKKMSCFTPCVLWRQICLFRVKGCRHEEYGVPRNWAAFGPLEWGVAPPRNTPLPFRICFRSNSSPLWSPWKIDPSRRVFQGHSRSSAPIRIDWISMTAC